MWRATLPPASQGDAADVEKIQDIIEKEGVLIWKAATDSLDIMVPKKNQRKIRRILRSNGWEPSVIIKDVQKLIENSSVRTSPWNEKYLRIGHRLDFKDYPPIEVIDEYITYLQNNYPSLVKVSTIGITFEQQGIKMITITNGKPNNSRILITGGHHAREWIGITTALYIANELVTKYQPPYIRNIDWHIIPLVNPDGYRYSTTRDRLWRKNRKPLGKCTGVDLNRNYPKHFDIPGITIKDTCDEVFSGAFPFTELETKAVYGVFKAMGSKIPTAYIDIHNYGQLILYPWAGSKTKSPVMKLLDHAGRKMRKVIINITGIDYSVGSPPALLYRASGSAIDFFHSKGVQFTYAIETRDTGKYGFLMPAKEIIRVGNELFEAVKALATFVR